MKTRNTNIEILRFVLMCFIFAWHLIVHGMDFTYIGKGIVDIPNVNMLLLGCVLFVPATYCFVFISGFYGIKFSVEKLLNILLWCFIISVGTSCVRMLVLHEQIGMKELYRALFPITNNKWWFMSAFILLYLFSPCLNLCKAHFTRRQFKSLLICLFIFLQLQLIAFCPSAGSNILGLFFIYLLGQYMKKYNIITKKKALTMYSLAFCTLYFILVSINYTSLLTHFVGINKIIWILLGYCNPLIITMSVSLFFIVSTCRPQYNSNINTVLSGNLFVYLLTDGTGIIQYKQIIAIISNNPMRGGAICLGIIIASLLIGYVVIKFTHSFINKLISLK